MTRISESEELFFLTETELLRRLDTEGWTPADSPNEDCWYIDHPEGEPSGIVVRADAAVANLTMTKVNNPTECQGLENSWCWDLVNVRLYMHLTSYEPPTSPGYTVGSLFWERIGTDIIDINGIPCEPLLKKETVPQLTSQTAFPGESGSDQSFGTISYINAGKYFDIRTGKYIYSARKIICKVGKAGTAYASLDLWFAGWVGDWELTDDAFSVTIEDYKKYVP